jgi:hypothetical protein
MEIIKEGDIITLTVHREGDPENTDVSDTHEYFEELISVRSD